MQTVDLGAGGVVTAEAFAVEVQFTDGHTQIVGPNHADYDAAEELAARVDGQIESGLWANRPLGRDAATAYVVSVGEVVAA